MLTVYALFTLFPIACVLSNSFRDSEPILTTLSLWPGYPGWRNFSHLMEATPIPRAFLNSVGITALSLALLVSVAVPLAFATSRFRFRLAEYVSIFSALVRWCRRYRCCR